MTTLELLAKVSEATAQLESARRQQDWLDAQSAALELARLFRQLQLEEKSKQQLVDAETASTWFKRMREAIR
jgi:hypothetical protein